MKKILGVVALLCVGFAGPVAAQGILAAVLPQGRSVQVGQTATAFATMLNAGANSLSNCGFAPSTSIPATFRFFQTNAANAVVGAAGARATIAAGGAQSFVFELTPNAAMASTEIVLSFTCDGVDPAPTFPGVNTFLFSASTTPIPDILSIAAVLSNDGITNVPGVNAPGAIGLMTVAAINLGADQPMTVEATLTGSAASAGTAVVCETDPVTSGCINPPTTNSISAQIKTRSSGQASSFGVFAFASSNIVFDPANSRAVLTFKDSSGVVRGRTSTAIRTRELIAPDTNADGVWDDLGEFAQGAVNAALPGTPNVLQTLAPLIKNGQEGLLFADLQDVAIARANTAIQLMGCLYQSQNNPSLASQLAGLTSLSLLTTEDRLNAGLAQRNLLGASTSEISPPASGSC